MACIFGAEDQWASVRAVAPAMFDVIASYEMEFGCTIKRGRTVLQLADSGTPYPLTADPSLVALAMGTAYDPARVITGHWAMPAGAFSRCGGPS